MVHGQLLNHIILTRKREELRLQREREYESEAAPLSLFLDQSCCYARQISLSPIKLRNQQMLEDMATFPSKFNFQLESDNCPGVVRCEAIEV